MHAGYNLTFFVALADSKERTFRQNGRNHSWTDAGVVMIDQTRLPREESVRHLPRLTRRWPRPSATW